MLYAPLVATRTSASSASSRALRQRRRRLPRGQRRGTPGG
ncbi:hypothetical protein B8V81_4764 [Paenibacillus pasadenensis]|uniref:Uncharacterized protein n=1 Tax=Paenibacillus pasadenensis TaxID=217090 RepID=A0A2N5N7N6_9BACL|nr:hypothetical protein B8V81_4764 [Paenibacillus pasadenensis]